VSHLKVKLTLDDNNNNNNNNNNSNNIDTKNYTNEEACGKWHIGERTLREEP